MKEKILHMFGKRQKFMKESATLYEIIRNKVQKA